MKIPIPNLVGMLILLLSVSISVVAEVPAGLVDPTRPLDYIVSPTQSNQSDLVLSSVMINGDVRAAVINGERVVENQIIDGSRVVSIKPGRVVLSKGSRSLELKVHRSKVKQSTDESSINKPSL